MSEPLIGYKCTECAHIRADYSCAAFPGGMPAAIFNGFDHSNPLAGDHGIQFAARPAGMAPPIFADLMLQEMEPTGIADAALV